MATKVAAKKLEKYDAADLARAPGDRWVNMSNALARAGHGLSVSEKRVIFIAISKLDSRAATNTEKIQVSRITAGEYAEAFDVDSHTAYDQLKATADSLYQRSITFFEPAHRRGDKPLEATVNKMRWVGRAKYHKGEGWIELSWWPEVLPHLTLLQRQFTQYQLNQAGALRSEYSWKLLDLLMRFKSTGWAEYTIEDFAASMEATEKQKSDFAAIRRKMIEPAVAELNKKDGWQITWSPIKAGRRIRAVRFEFKRDPQGRLDLDASKSAASL
jgi:plasmid replication initiation protein